MMGIGKMGMVVVLSVRLKMDGHVEEVHQSNPVSAHKIYQPKQQYK